VLGDGLLLGIVLGVVWARFKIKLMLRARCKLKVRPRIGLGQRQGLW
jgi:hypothetical protein